jgi:hypothetical protein
MGKPRSSTPSAVIICNGEQWVELEYNTKADEFSLA